MAPSTAVEKDHVYVSLLKCIKTLDVDWKEFAKETGITLVGNAQRKLKESLKKDGLTLSGGQIVPLTDDGDTSKTDTSTKKTKAALKKAKVTGKRKKTDDDGEGDNEETVKTKKARNQAAVEDAEEVI